MTLRRLLAVDPGGTTGLASVGWYDNGDPCDFTSNEKPKPYEAWLQGLEGVILQVPPDAIVCERFTITSQTLTKAREYDALYIIGTLKYLCAREGITFALQSPSDAKRFCSDDRLKKIGWWKSTAGGHANDAARHAFLYSAKAGRINPVEVDGRAER